MESGRNIHLSKRLALCASLVRVGSRAVDVGSDHALLPIFLVLAGVSPCAIASDINEGPIERAKMNIAEYGVSDQIKAIVADGLDEIEPGSVQDIIIAGMGGDNIADILSRAEWLKNGEYRIIAQPMTRAEVLRGWLFANGFALLEEQAVREGKRVYTVMLAGYDGAERQATNAMLFGGALLSKSDEASRAFLQKEANALLERAGGLRCEGKETNALELEQTAQELIGVEYR